MTVGTPTLGRLVSGRARWLPFGVIAVVVVAWTLLAFSSTSLVRLIMVGAAGGFFTLAAIRRWPIQSLAFVPVLLVPPQFVKVFAYEVTVLLLAAGIWFWAWTRREPWIGKVDRLEVLVWLFMLWGVFTFFWVRDWWWWLFCFRRLFIGAMALWVAWRLPHFVNPRLMMVGVAAGTCALALSSLARAYSVGWFGSIHQTYMRRTATTLGWGDSNFIASILTLMLPTCMHLAISGKGWPRLLGWIAAPLTAILIAVAASRGGAVMVLGIILFMLFRARIKSWIPYVTAPILLALLLVGPGAQLLLARFTDVRDMLSIVIRLMYFRETWYRLRDHWPLGIGHGQGYGYMDRLFQEDPHNWWLMIGSELGIVGLVLWTSILIVLYRRIMKIVRNPETKTAGQAMQLTFWIAQLNCLFEPTMPGLQYHFMWYWLIGLYLGYMDRHTGKIVPYVGAPEPGTAPAPRVTPSPSPASA